MKKKSKFSLRSQASWHKQRSLEDDLLKNEGWLRVAENNVKRLTEANRQVTKHMSETGAVLPSYLGDLCRELEDEKRRLAVHKDRALSLREQIKSLERPSRSQAAERLKQQKLTGRLVSERLKADRAIGRAVDELRKLLQGREELSAEMRTAVNVIDLDVAGDSLDEARFQSLLNALPSDPVAESARWANWFLGEDRGNNPYVVIVDTLTLKETLASCGYHKRGDLVYLAEGQARNLIADRSIDYPPDAEPEQQEAAEMGIAQG